MRIVLTFTMMLSLAAISSAQTASQDMKDAGHETKEATTKEATKDTGKGIERGTKKTGRAIKNGTQKAVNKTANASEKGADKVKEKTE